MDQKKIGCFIRELRQHAGLTRQQLGTRLGVSEKVVSRWESGAVPDASLLKQLAAVLGVTPEEILAGARKNGSLSPENEGKLMEKARRNAAYYEEKKKKLVREWRHSHRREQILPLCACLALLAVAFVLKQWWLGGLSVLAAAFYETRLYNRMMAHVDDEIFGKLTPEERDAARQAAQDRKAGK